MTSLINPYIAFPAASGPYPTTLDNPVAWYDAQTLGLSNGNAVSTWADQFAGGVELTGVSSPTYRSAGLNSLPSVEFSNSAYFTSAALSAISQPYTMILVGIWDVNNTSDRFVADDAAGTGIRTLGANGRIYGFAGTTDSDAAIFPTAGTPFRFMYVFNGASSVMRLNTTEVTTGLDPGANTFGTFQVGAASGGNQLDGHISELMVFGDALDGTERGDMDAFLVDKWGF